MKEKVVQKKDVAFLVALIIFSAVCMLRFFDHNLYERNFLLAIMNNYYFVWITNIIMQAVFVFMSFLFIRKVGEEKKSSFIFLLVFLAVFVCSMFWNENYFGASDVYVIIMAFISMMLFVFEKGMFLIPIFAFLGTFLSPICSLSVFTALFMAMFIFESKKGLIIDVASVIAALCGFFISNILGYINFDVRIYLSIKQVIIILLMFIPYYVFGVIYFIKVKKNKKYTVSLVVGLLAPICEFLLRDCSRAIFYGFMYYILLMSILLVKGEKTTSTAICELEEIIKKYIKWPALLIAYAFVIITIWISGPLTLFEETFVGL